MPIREVAAPQASHPRPGSGVDPGARVGAAPASRVPGHMSALGTTRLPGPAARPQQTRQVARGVSGWARPTLDDGTAEGDAG